MLPMLEFLKPLNCLMLIRKFFFKWTSREKEKTHIFFVLFPALWLRRRAQKILEVPSV